MTLAQRLAGAGMLVAVLGSLLVIGVLGFSPRHPAPEPPQDRPAPTQAPEVGESAPQAKVETSRSCRFVVHRFYGRDSGLERWRLTGVDRVPTGKVCP